jgi:hypothetical protein
MALNSNESIGLIKAGIESGSIKLRGSAGCGDIEAAKEVALIDSVNRYQYLRHFPTSLGTALQILPEKVHCCNYGV